MLRTAPSCVERLDGYAEFLAPEPTFAASSRTRTRASRSERLRCSISKYLEAANKRFRCSSFILPPLCREFLEGKNWSRNHMTKCIHKQVGLVASVESKRHFFAVGLKMLGAHAMPRANDAALQKRERGFNGVRVDVALGVDAEFVSDGLVLPLLSQILRGAPVPKRIIGEQDVHVLT